MKLKVKGHTFEVVLVFVEEAEVLKWRAEARCRTTYMIPQHVASGMTPSLAIEALALELSEPMNETFSG